MSVLILNGKTAPTKPNEDLLINKGAHRFEPPIINGLMPTDITINGLTRPPVLSGCVFYTPLWHPALSPTVFKSLDANAHTCTVTGALWTPQGRSFDGDDNINCGSASSLRFTGAFTVLAWINSSKGASNHDIVMRGNMGANATAAWGFSITSTGNLMFLLVKNTVDDNFSATQNATLTVDGTTWYQVGGVFDTTQVLLYKNGLLEPSTAAGDLTSTINDPTEPVIIGKETRDANLFQGLISEVIIFSRALTLSEIQNNYLATKWRYTG